MQGLQLKSYTEPHLAWRLGYIKGIICAGITTNVESYHGDWPVMPYIKRTIGSGITAKVIYRTMSNMEIELACPI